MNKWRVTNRGADIKLSNNKQYNAQCGPRLPEWCRQAQHPGHSQPPRREQQVLPRPPGTLAPQPGACTGAQCHGMTVPRLRRGGWRGPPPKTAAKPGLHGSSMAGCRPRLRSSCCSSEAVTGNAIEPGPDRNVTVLRAGGQRGSFPPPPRPEQVEVCGRSTAPGFQAPPACAGPEAVVSRLFPAPGMWPPSTEAPFTGSTLRPQAAGQAQNVPFSPTPTPPPTPIPSILGKRTGLRGKTSRDSHENQQGERMCEGKSV